MNNAKEAQLEIANIIWRQISVMTKMACGARETVIMESGLKFKVGGRMRYIEVDLDPSDTYTVRLVRVQARTYKRIIVEEHTGIYCDMLSETVYHACNK